MPKDNHDAIKSDLDGLLVHYWDNQLVVMPPSPPPVVHNGRKLPTTAAAASGAGGGLMKRTAPSTSNEDATKSDFLQGKTFVQKLHAILEVPKYSSIISWNDAGNVATIHDADAFISTIVPAHFKKSKFGSFIRKMRRWGFSAITKKCTSPSEEGPDTVVEFSSEHFLRDQPDLCLLMKDERHVKKQFSFLDHTVRNVNHHENINQGSTDGLNAHYSPNAANCHSESQRSGVDNSIPPMISPNQQRQSFHSAMPMMNTMMPPPPPSQLNYPPYGYGAPHPPRLGYGGPSSPSFQYPAPDGYPPYPQQQHHQMMPQNSQQQKRMQQYQQQEHQEQLQQQRQRMMLNQEFTSPSADPNLAAVTGKRKAATSITRSEFTETRVSTAKASGSAAVLTSSSEESAELLPNTKVDVNVQIHSRLDAEQDVSTR